MQHLFLNTKTLYKGKSPANKTYTHIHTAGNAKYFSGPGIYSHGLMAWSNSTTVVQNMQLNKPPLNHCPGRRLAAQSNSTTSQTASPQCKGPGLQSNSPSAVISIPAHDPFNLHYCSAKSLRQEISQTSGQFKNKSNHKQYKTKTSPVQRVRAKYAQLPQTTYSKIPKIISQCCPGYSHKYFII